MQCLLVAALLAGCGSKKSDDPAPAAASGPIKVDTKTLWADFHSGDNVAMLKKYHDPVMITGTVSKNGPLTYLDIDDKTKVELDFTDKAAGATLAPGRTATVTCNIGGRTDNRILTFDCKL